MEPVLCSLLFPGNNNDVHAEQPNLYPVDPYNGDLEGNPNEENPEVPNEWVDPYDGDTEVTDDVNPDGDAVKPDEDDEPGVPDGDNEEAESIHDYSYTNGDGFGDFEKIRKVN